MTFIRSLAVVSLTVVGLGTVFGFSTNETDEVYFRIPIYRITDVDNLTRLISIDDVRGDTVYAYATSEQMRQLRSLDYKVELLPHPSSLFHHDMFDGRSTLLYEWDRYPTYQGYLGMMRQFAQDYPTICRLDTIGYSVQGRLLLAVKISDSVDVREDESRFLYTSTMHGDETVGYVLLLRLIDYMLTNYGRETPEGERITRLVNELEIWINPLANPDGTYRLGGDTTVNNARRYNANGIDLNRDFPDRVSDTNNTTANRQLETQAMMRFAAKHNFTLSANFHGGAQVVNYPWDNGAPSGTYSASPDDAWFNALSRVYAMPNADIMSGGFTNGITNGCKWYAIFGGRQDWIYWWYGGRETTIELWNTKNPAGSVLPQRWVNNKESLLAYMEGALKGVRGTVVDGVTLAPLKARIDIVGIPNAPVYSDSIRGGFSRLLLPGTYDLIVRASGYQADTLRQVVVTNRYATHVDMTLKQSQTSAQNSVQCPEVDLRLLQSHPNPFNPRTAIRFSVAERQAVSLTVHDLLGREIAVLVDEQKEPGTYEVTWDGASHPSAVYFCRLRTAGFAATRKLVLMK
jgi:hypothetical protein